MSTDPTRPLSDEDFEYIFSRVPRLCVDLVVKTPAGVVLTLRKLPTWTNRWHFPGGGVLYGETVTEAIQRVAKKEIGVGVTVEKLLGYMEFPSEKVERGYGTTVSMTFLCAPYSLEFKDTSGESSEIRIFSELPDTMFEEQKAFLECHPEWQS